MQTIFKEMRFSESQKCSCEDELADIEHELVSKKISAQGFINLLVGEMGDHPMRNISFIIDKFPNLAKLMELSSVRKNLSNRGGDPALKAFIMLAEELAEDHNNEFKKLYDVESIPADVFKEFKSFGSLVDQIHKDRPQVQVGEHKAADTTLDLMVRLESHHGAVHICDIEGFENVRAWVEQYIVDAIPHVIDVDDEGHIKLESDNEHYAHAFIDFLKSQSTNKGTIVRCLELVQTEQDLVKMLDATT
jgi:hypothetical protein